MVVCVDWPGSGQLDPVVFVAGDTTKIFDQSGAPVTAGTYYLQVEPVTYTTHPYGSGTTPGAFTTQPYTLLVTQ